jgi:hypothetical protein
MTIRNTVRAAAAAVVLVVSAGTATAAGAGAAAASGASVASNPCAKATIKMVHNPGTPGIAAIATWSVLNCSDSLESLIDEVIVYPPSGASCSSILWAKESISYPPGDRFIEHKGNTTPSCAGVWDVRLKIINNTGRPVLHRDFNWTVN